jgi:hypothetical protein
VNKQSIAGFVKKVLCDLGFNYKKVVFALNWQMKKWRLCGGSGGVGIVPGFQL